MAQARKHSSRIGLRIAEHSTGMIVSALFLAPIVWTVLSTFKPAQEARRPPLPPWPTTGFSVENYATLNTFGDGLWLPAQNSIYVALMTMLLSVVVSVLAGYGFSRFRFPLKNLLFVIILSTIMIPFQSILTPIFLVLTKIGLHNTLTGLVCVYVTLQLPFSIFMMRNAFDAVPREIEEAARIDGAGTLRMLWSVVVPLLLPSLVAIGIIVAILNYNEFLLATFLTQSVDAQTFPVALSLFYGDRTPHFGKIAAASFIGVIPVFAAAVFFQRWLVGGLTTGAVR
jgi:multiple sugar transport system permease protein